MNKKLTLIREPLRNLTNYEMEIEGGEIVVSASLLAAAAAVVPSPVITVAVSADKWTKHKLFCKTPQPNTGFCYGPTTTPTNGGGCCPK